MGDIKGRKNSDEYAKVYKDDSKDCERFKDDCEACLNGHTKTFLGTKIPCAFKVKSTTGRFFFKPSESNMCHTAKATYDTLQTPQLQKPFINTFVWRTNNMKEKVQFTSNLNGEQKTVYKRTCCPPLFTSDEERKYKRKVEQDERSGTWGKWTFDHYEDTF